MQIRPTVFPKIYPLTGIIYKLDPRISTTSNWISAEKNLKKYNNAKKLEEKAGDKHSWAIFFKRYSHTCGFSHEWVIFANISVGGHKYRR